MVTFKAGELKLKSDEVSFIKLLTIKAAGLSLSFISRELKDLKAKGRTSLSFKLRWLDSYYNKAGLLSVIRLSVIVSLIKN